jgi:hypothetical protein
MEDSSFSMYLHLGISLPDSSERSYIVVNVQPAIHVFIRTLGTIRIYTEYNFRISDLKLGRGAMKFKVIGSESELRAIGQFH